MHLLSDAGGIRTRNREGLSFAAVPVRVPRRDQASGIRLQASEKELIPGD